MKDVHVKLFNGFNYSEGFTNGSGEYSLDLFSSTKNTYFILSFTKKNFKPEIIKDKLKNSSNIKIHDILLNKLELNNNGFVTGTLFTSVRGGKRKPHFGISSFKKSDVSFTSINGKIYKAENIGGIYEISLPPGNYYINKKKRRRLIVESGDVKIVNISKGRILID